MTDEQTPSDSGEGTVATPEAQPAETEPVAVSAAPEAESEVATANETTRNLDVILDLDLPLTVRFGQTQMALGELVQIGPGSVVSLERAPSDPVEVLVNGKVIARGEVVVIDENFGVRITEILSLQDRIKTLGERKD